MKNRNWMIFLGLAVLILSALACEFSASTAKIKDAYLVADETSGQKTTTYSQDQPFLLIVELANAPDSTRVKAVWTILHEDGSEEQFVEKELETGDSPITFSASNNGLWPVSGYKVELYLNDELDRVVDFFVK
ncbi:MAG: hypothetical protein GX577_13595 [Leptolinea sp.]|nr:hypothetical protein [Leptolinea sp.]